MLSYDAENRLAKSYNSSLGIEYYAYDPEGRRVWKGKGSGAEERVYFYGVDGALLTTYRVWLERGLWNVNAISGNLYFAGRLIRTKGQAVVLDRLGSVVVQREVGNWGTVLSRFGYYPMERSAR